MSTSPEVNTLEGVDETLMKSNISDSEDCDKITVDTSSKYLYLDSEYNLEENEFNAVSELSFMLEAATLEAHNNDGNSEKWMSYIC